MTQLKHHGERAGTEAAAVRGGLLLRGLTPSVRDVLADSPAHGSIVSRFEGAWWWLLPDGRFFFEPSRLSDMLSNGFILQGRYEQRDGRFTLWAESYGGRAKMLALEGFIRPEGEGHRLDCLFFDEGSVVPVHHVTQPLTTKGGRVFAGGSRKIRGVAVPALYDVELSGSTTGGSFESVQACLYTADPDPSAPEPVDVHLTIDNGSALDAMEEENGTCSLLMPYETFAAAAHGTPPSDWRAGYSVSDGHVRLGLEDIPGFQSLFGWWEVEQVRTAEAGETRHAKTYFDARAVSLDLRVTDDKVFGSVRAEGVAAGGASGRYEATIVGRRAADAPQTPARLERKIASRTRAPGWRDRDTFDGEWQSRRFGSLSLSQSGDVVTGTVSAYPRAALEGTASERRSVFRAGVEGGDVRCALRAIRGGELLVGFVSGPDEGGCAVELFYRAGHSSRLVAETLRTSGPEEWSRLADLLQTLGRDGEALSLYEHAVDAFAESRRRSEPYAEEWALWLSYEWHGLLALMNCLQTRRFRTSALHRRLGGAGGEAESFGPLLRIFERAVRTQAELEELADMHDAREAGSFPEFGAMLARQIDFWRGSLSDAASRLEVLEASQRPFGRLLRVLVSARRYEHALVVAETAKARSFSDSMQDRIFREAVRESLSALGDDDVGRLLAMTSATTAPVELEWLKRPARKRPCTVVEYFIDDAALLTWVITPDGRINFREHSEEGLKERVTGCVAAARAGLSVGSREAVMQSAPPPPRQFLPPLAELYRLLVEPLARWLPTDEDASLLFVPHDALFLVPFPALFDGSKYLAERYAISVGPSLRLVETTQQLVASRKTYPPGVLVAGDPLMPALSRGGRAERLPQLEFARREAEQVARELGTTALLDGEASKAKVIDLLPHRQIVHLATHGLIDEQVAPGEVPGALALAASGGDDGFLTATEIARLELRAKLVVLSACNTGRGRLSADGIVGLTRAFMTAGAECVVASLWAVADCSTQELMVDFYKNLRRGLPPAHALRRSMLKLKADPRYDNPLYWAAFTVTGQTHEPLFERSHSE
jgi:CHAT domain-containing protein